MWRRRALAGAKGTGAAGAIALTLAAAPALAGERADFSLTFAERAPGAPTTMAVKILYKAPGDPEGKPPPLRRVVLAAPAGTRYALDAVPACAASDAELRAQGAAACPEATRVGRGSLTAITGFGPPADPFVADVIVFNVPGGFLELVADRTSGRTLGLDRAKVEGETATLVPPSTPGGPPEGETAIRAIDIAFDVPAYLRTPPACPSDGLWRSAGTFTFSDGATVTEPAATPCAGAAPGAPSRAARLVVRPRRMAAGRRRNLRLHVRRAAPGCAAGAEVRIAGRVARTGADGRVVLPLRLARGRHRVSVGRPGCPTLRATVRAA